MLTSYKLELSNKKSPALALIFFNYRTKSRRLLCCSL